MSLRAHSSLIIIAYNLALNMHSTHSPFIHQLIYMCIYIFHFFVFISSCSQLFQATINQGTIPPEWKEANVVPIFKKGDKSHASNYRPVSLTVVTCKMLEHIICSSIHKHLEKHRILTDAQHGFRKKRSCESQLMLTVQDLANKYGPLRTNRPYSA